MFTFINNYRNAVKESIANRDYVSAVARTVAFPLFYGCAALTDVVSNALDAIGNKDKVEAEEKSIEYSDVHGKRVVENWYTNDNGAKVHSITTFDEPITVDIDPVQEEVLRKAFAKAIDEVKKNGKTVTLGDMIDKVA